MKGARNENTKQSKQGIVNKPRPEIRDNLDSRAGEETGYAGGHNTKEVKSKKPTTGRNKE